METFCMYQEEIKALKAQLDEANKLVRKITSERDEALLKLNEYEAKIRKAEKASRMKSLFLANMSHEIRTPLNAIEGFSRVIAETDSPEERMKMLEIVESNNNRLLSLINEILDLSRVESGEIQMKKAPANLTDMCANIKQIFKFRCPEQIKLVASIPSKTVILNTDINRVTQVYCNLISNALKHTISGSITFGYNVSEDGKDIIMQVADTGSGIDPNDIDSIFQTYVSKDAEHQNGYGLGLPLSKIIVEKLGGHISVKSKLGEGSTFTFVLPFDGSFAGNNTTSKPCFTISRTLRAKADVDISKLKLVLVAEDEDCNWELIQNVLNNRYRILRAKNGIEAVTMNEEEHPDLILMDIRMPEMNGLDATRIIKEINPVIPVVALSAYAFEDTINEAMDAGCNEFISKPFKMEHLIETIEKFI
ncbi:MAG: response regulator [Prevotella sp.]|nr:response regulator [Prevotella sp.]